MNRIPFRAGLSVSYKEILLINIILVGEGHEVHKTSRRLNFGEVSAIFSPFPVYKVSYWQRNL